MSNYETVRYCVDKRVATISLNRPQKLNAFNAQMRLDLLLALTEVHNDDAIRVVVITGKGRGFSAGADLEEGLGEHNSAEDQILAEYKPFLMAIQHSEKLHIAAVNGACAGIGSALAMTCDLIVMADNAYIYQAFAAIGLVPDGGATWHLVNTLGYKKALEVIVEAGKIPADQCLALGLINKVVAADELVQCSQNWAELLAKGSPLAQKYSKQLLQQVMQGDLANAIDLEAKAQNMTADSADSKNAVSAFLSKQAPVFTGC